MRGEIKSKDEINRDLTGYLSQWNSNQSFGGKSKDRKLSNDLPVSINKFSEYAQAGLL